MITNLIGARGAESNALGAVQARRSAERRTEAVLIDMKLRAESRANHPTAYTSSTTPGAYSNRSA